MCHMKLNKLMMLATGNPAASEKGIMIRPAITLQKESPSLENHDLAPNWRLAHIIPSMKKCHSATCRSTFVRRIPNKGPRKSKVARWLVTTVVGSCFSFWMSTDACKTAGDIGGCCKKITVTERL